MILGLTTTQAEACIIFRGLVYSDVFFADAVVTAHVSDLLPSDTLSLTTQRPTAVLELEQPRAYVGDVSNYLSTDGKLYVAFDAGPDTSSPTDLSWLLGKDFLIALEDPNLVTEWQGQTLPLEGAFIEGHLRVFEAICSLPYIHPLDSPYTFMVMHALRLQENQEAELNAIWRYLDDWGGRLALDSRVEELETEVEALERQLEEAQQ